MAFTYGFYNSVDHDRTYDAVQLSQIFDGIITDGVYATYLQGLMPRASSSGTAVVIQPGRAWFNHTWSYVDSDYPMEILPAHSAYTRIDALVLDINTTKDYRENSIKWVEGTPASTPVKPTLTNSNGHYQYPLAYVTRLANAATITYSNLEITVGTSACPFVTGVLESIDIDEMLATWNSQFNDGLRNMNNTFETWFEGLEHGFDEEKETLDQWIKTYTSTLDDDTASKLMTYVADLYSTEPRTGGAANCMFWPYYDGLEKTNNGITFRVTHEYNNENNPNGQSGNVPEGTISISGTTGSEPAEFHILYQWDEAYNWLVETYYSRMRYGSYDSGLYPLPHSKYDNLDVHKYYRLFVKEAAGNEGLWINGRMPGTVEPDPSTVSDYDKASPVHFDVGYRELQVLNDGNGFYINMDFYANAVSIPYYIKNSGGDDYYISRGVDLWPHRTSSMGRVYGLNIRTEKRENRTQGGSSYYRYFWEMKITVDANTTVGVTESDGSITPLRLQPILIPISDFDYLSLGGSEGWNALYPAEDMSSMQVAGNVADRMSYSNAKLTSMILNNTKYVEKTAQLNTSSETSVTFTDPRITDDSYLELIVNDPSIPYRSAVYNSSTKSITYTFPVVGSARTIKLRLYIR